MPFLLDTSWDNGMAQLIKHILTGKGLGIVIMAEAHPSRALQPSTSHSPGACQSKQVRGKVSSKDQTWPGLWCISTHLSPRQSVFRAWAPILFTLYPPHTHVCFYMHMHMYETARVTAQKAIYTGLLLLTLSLDNEAAMRQAVPLSSPLLCPVYTGGMWLSEPVRMGPPNRGTEGWHHPRAIFLLHVIAFYSSLALGWTWLSWVGVRTGGPCLLTSRR